MSKAGRTHRTPQTCESGEIDEDCINRRKSDLSRYWSDEKICTKVPPHFSSLLVCGDIGRYGYENTFCIILSETGTHDLVARSALALRCWYVVHAARAASELRSLLSCAPCRLDTRSSKRVQTSRRDFSRLNASLMKSVPLYHLMSERYTRIRARFSH
jgi:hypothetical protein